MSPRARRSGKIFVMVVAAAAAASIAACSSDRRVSGLEWVDPSAVYEGPEIQLGRSGELHAVRLVAPSAGWMLDGDRLDVGANWSRAFLTVTRPPSDTMQAQAIQELDLVLEVDAREPLAVYVRVVDGDGVAGPYRLAVDALSPALSQR